MRAKMALPAQGAPWTPEGLAYLVGQSFPVVFPDHEPVLVTIIEAHAHPVHPLAVAVVLVESKGMMPQGLAPGSRHPELN